MKNEGSAAGRNGTGRAKRPGKLVVISTVILVIAVLLCLVVTIQTLSTGYTSFFGYSVFRVVTGSMEPTIPVNAVLLCKHMDIEDPLRGYRDPPRHLHPA